MDSSQPARGAMRELERLQAKRKAKEAKERESDALSD